MAEAAGHPSMVIDKFGKYKERQVPENHIRIFGDLSFLFGCILFKKGGTNRFPTEFLFM